MNIYKKMKIQTYSSITSFLYFYFQEETLHLGYQTVCKLLYFLFINLLVQSEKPLPPCHPSYPALIAAIVPSSFPRLGIFHASLTFLWTPLRFRSKTCPPDEVIAAMEGHECCPPSIFFCHALHTLLCY